MKKLFASASVALTVAWLTMRALGFWRYASVLSGTLPEGATSLSGSTDRAILLLVVHFAFVLFAAPLAAAALCLHVLETRERRANAETKQLGQQTV